MVRPMQRVREAVTLSSTLWAALPQQKGAIYSSLCLQEGLTEVCILRHLDLHSFSLGGRARRRHRFGE